MMRSPHVGGTDSLVDLTRQINTVLHNSDPRWSLLPRSADEVGGIVMVAEHGSEPGDLRPLGQLQFSARPGDFFSL